MSDIQVPDIAELVGRCSLMGNNGSDGFCAANRLACIKPSTTAVGPMVSLRRISALACSWLSLCLAFDFPVS